ncbi:MAG TPA: ABC transporter substrate-binding protein, partial [Acidimicrobiales bacterium]|nr:ABC transporter substrate-binding protein [Acidimicrobiales bacterium]
GTATGGSGGGSSATGSGAGASGGDAGDGGVAGDCAPEPSDEVGVTDTEIRLGNVSTVSGPIAGFGQTGLNAVKAYFNFVNSQGGVCGRQLVFVGADDRLDSGQNRAETQRLASEVLGFVGGTTVVDAGGTSVIDGTDIVATQLAVSDAAIQSANVFSPNPIDPAGTTQGTMGMWQYFARTRGVTKVAIVYPAQADARTRGRAYEVDIRNAGLEVVGPFEVAITETNYVNVAQQIENSGAQGVITALEITGMTRLAQAFAQIDFHPAVPFYGAQAYGRPFLEQAGAAAEGTTLGLAFAIFEDAPAVPAVADFLDWYGRTAPGSAPDFFAVMGWTAADMMVQALA